MNDKKIICEGLVVAKLIVNGKGSTYISFYTENGDYLGTQFVKTKEVDYYVKRIK